MRLARCSPALVLALVLTPALARAAWLPGGNLIGGEGDFGHGFVATASGPDRTVVAWIRPVAPDRYEVRAQAWTADGDLATGWPAAGVAVGGSFPLVYGRLAIVEDGEGGAFVAWTTGDGAGLSAYVQHVSAAGSLAAGWPADGLRLGEDASSSPAIAHDGAGGLLVGLLERDDPHAYHLRARIRNIDATGAPRPGWPVEGRVIPNVHGIGLVVDSESHVFVSTVEIDPLTYALVGTRVLRLDGSGAPDPAWPQTGALLALVYGAEMRLFPDGAGGVFAGWREVFVCDGCSGPTRLITRVLGDGSPDDGWIPSPRAYTNAPDRTGGMLLGLVNDGRPSALRLDAGGAVMPGWGAGGNVAMTEVVDPRDVQVAADGEGGAFVAWRDDRTGQDRLYASRLDGSGRLADGWPATGTFVGTGRGNLVDYQLVTLGAGVAIALWLEWTPSGHSGYLLALRPGEPGPLAPLRPVGADVGFGVVQVRPNPTRGPILAIVELPNEGPARLELVDAAGRVLESQDFAFERQARGAVHFNRGRALPAGVYWLNVTQRTRRASKKVVVLE